MAIKNKNIMFSLVENLNENKMNEIKRFKDLKEATVDNIDEGSSVESYESKIRDAFDDKNEVYNLQFNGNDETQFNAKSYDELLELWIDFCKEEKIDPNCLDNVEFGVEECDKNLKESIEMTGSDMTIGDFYQDSVDKLKANTLEKDMVDVYDTDIDYEGPTWVIGSDLTDEGKQVFRDFLSLNIEKFIDDGDRYVLYVNTDGNIDIIDNFLQAQAGNISESLYDEYFIDIDETMNEDAPIDEPSPEDFEDDRKNTLIAKKDELEARLGDILQSIKDKQMDTDEFRKLSREAAELDSQIMDIDNQIRGVYECDKRINESDEPLIGDYEIGDYERGIADEVIEEVKNAIESDESLIDRFWGPDAENNTEYYDTLVNICNRLNLTYEKFPDIVKSYIDSELQNYYFGNTINESDEDVCKGIVDQLVATGMTKEQAEQTAKGICNIFKNKVGSNQVVNEDVSVNGDDNSLNNIVWDNIEDYDDSEKEEIRNILQNLDFEVAGVDGHSVSIKLKPNGMVFWIDYSNDGSDIVGDWNQYIFDTTNSEDRIRKAVQTSYYEDTGDTIALEPMESAGFEYLENKGIIKDIGKGYSFTDINESATPITEATITEKNLLKSQGNVYMFECKGNPKFTHIVGENYDESENTLENVETYNNKEDADKDYLGRCDIKSEG